MSTKIANKTPYLITSRLFPSEILELSVQLGKTYIDIANNVNMRTIGIFATGNASITGEAWYLTGGSRKQQSLRQVYTFTATGNIPHGLNLTQLDGFVRIYGTFTDGTNWFPLPYVNQVAANNQIDVYVSPTNIVITAGGGVPPTVVRGYVVLEWLSAS